MNGLIWFLSGCVVIGILAWLAIYDKIPAPTDEMAGCVLESSLKTDELQYCGKACWKTLYVNTYQCPTSKKVLIQ